MLKADVLAKLEEYKDRPVEIGLSDEGAVMHGNINGHWLFQSGENLVEIKVNTGDGTYGFSVNTQQQRPFTIMTTPFEFIMYVKAYISNDSGDIAAKVTGLTPVGTTKTLDAITKEIQSSSIRKALSPRGNLNTPEVAPDGTGGYGSFKGFAVSTEIDGLPKYMKDALVPEDE